MSDSKDKLLAALVLMVEQYLERKDQGFIDSYAMTAGENAMRLLAECGLIELSEQGRIIGQWTAAARQYLL